MAGLWLARMWLKSDKGTLAVLGASMLVIIGLWPTIAIWPLKILVVFFHELSHGIAAIATGGRIVSIEVVAREGGLCITQGGNPFITLSAGYLGSLIWGGLILQGALRTKMQQKIAIGIGILLGVVTLVYLRPVISFGFVFGLLAAAALVLCGWKASRFVNTVLLAVIGLTSILYAPLDIIVDTLWHQHLPSDARLLAQLTHIPTVIWGLMWTVLAFIGAAYFLLAASTAPRKPQGRGNR